MDVLENLKKLPEVAAILHPMTNKPAMVRRGVMGYQELVTGDGFSIEKFNAAHKVSSAQQSAMLMGSMFGWDVPAADPDHETNKIRTPSLINRPGDASKAA